MARLLGMPLMPWQQYVADVALEVDPLTGWWAYDKVLLTVQRRAGKSALDTAVKVDRMATGKDRRLWMSAQGGEEALELWRETCRLLELSPLAGKFRAYTTTGKERLIWLPTNSRLTPIPPNGDKLHSKAIDLLSLDELWWYDAAAATKMKAGYRPTFLTTNAQAWLISTMGTELSIWLNAERQEGRRAVELGANRGTAYFEWSVPEVVNGVKTRDLEDDELVRLILQYHPAAGVHPLMPTSKLEQFIRDDLADELIGRVGVLRSYGNISTEDEGERLFHSSIVVATTTLERIPAGAVPFLAFDVDPKLRAASISAGWRDAGGVGLTELIEHGLGTRWVAGAVIGYLERQGLRRVTCNNAGPARDVADESERAGYEVQRVSAPDYSAACVRFHEQIKAARPYVLHYGDSDTVDAFGYVAWRKLGAGLAFDTTGEPITPVTSATLALWGADHPPVVEPERPRSRVF